MGNKEQYSKQLEYITNILPFDPRVFYTCLKKLEDERDQTTFDKLSEIIMNCQTLTLKMFIKAKEIVNDKAYQLKDINNLRYAVSIIGRPKMRSLLCSMGMTEIIDSLYELDNTRWNFYKVHAITTGVTADLIMTTNNIKLSGDVRRDEFYPIGLFSNIGRIFFYIWKKEDYYENVEKNLEFSFPKTNRIELEKKHFNTTHENLGSILAAKWNMPSIYKNAAYFHEDIENFDIHKPEIQIIIFSNLLARIAMPMANYVHNAEFEKFVEERKRYINNIDIYLRKMDYFKRKKMNSQEYTSDLIRTINYKTIQILQDLGITIPGGNDDIQIKELRKKIKKYINQLSKNIHIANIPRNYKQKFELLEYLPLEIADLFNNYLNSDNVYTKYNFYHKIFEHTIQLIHNLLLHQLYNHKDIPQHIFTQFLTLKIAKLYDNNKILKLILNNYPEIFENCFVLQQTTEEEFVEFIQYHNNMSKLFRDKSHLNERSIKQNLLLALLKLLGLLEFFKHGYFFAIIDFDNTEDGQNSIYHIYKWNSTDEHGIPEDINNENSGKLISPLRLKKINSLYYQKNEKEIINLYPWVVYRKCFICRKEHMFLLKNIDIDNNMVLYTMNNAKGSNPCETSISLHDIKDLEELIKKIKPEITLNYSHS